MQNSKSISITAINGSPSKNGNSATLLNWVLEGCQSDSISINTIHLVDYNIKFCKGCYSCLVKGNCILKDDFDPLFQQLLSSDAIIAASPVYDDFVSGLMKVFIDRQALLNCYTDIFSNKVSLGIATSNGSSEKRVASYLADFFGTPSSLIYTVVEDIKYTRKSLKDHHPMKLPLQAKKKGARLINDIYHPPRVKIPTYQKIRKRFSRNFFIKPIIKNNPEKFPYVFKIWRENHYI